MKRANTPCPRDPVGLSMSEAAVFLGVSPGLFLRLVDDGRMPRPRRADGRRIWDAEELIDAFHRLPREAGAASAVDDDSAQDPYDTVRA